MCAPYVLLSVRVSVVELCREWPIPRSGTTLVYQPGAGCKPPGWPAPAVPVLHGGKTQGCLPGSRGQIGPNFDHSRKKELQRPGYLCKLFLSLSKDPRHPRGQGPPPPGAFRVHTAKRSRPPWIFPHPSADFGTVPPPSAALAATAHLFRHETTGAELLWLDRPSENKTFSVSFSDPAGG